MNQRCFTVSAAILATMVAGPFALAQTPAQIIVASGNGQVICSGCAVRPSQFQPVYALVLDASGRPVPNASVTWSVTAGNGTIAGQQSVVVTTNSSGVSTVTPLSAVGGLFGGGLFGAADQQIQLSAQAGGALPVTYTETVAFGDQSGNSQVFVDFSQAGLGQSLSGTAGGSSTPITVKVASITGGGVPNVSVRLVNSDGSSGPSTLTPSAYCQTGTGADPYSVLTDASGTATCTPLFGSVGGTDAVTLEIGGVPAGEWSIPGTAAGTLFNPGNVTYNPGGGALPLPEFSDSGVINISVKAVPLGSIVTTSGNTQSANPGQALAAALVATVRDTSGSPLAGQAVTWTATPANAVTFTSQTTTSNSSGQVSTNVTFTSAASGAVTIKVTSATNNNISASFTETAVPPIVISSVTKAGGDAQSATVNTAFATPLQVQVAVSGGSAAGVPVTFAITGPATLSATSATTNASGVAIVTVTAGAQPGNVAVTATVQSATVTFNLTVVPAGPAITASNFLNGADQQRGSISPCSLATIAATGVASSVPAVAGPLVGPLSGQLSNVRVAFNTNDQAGIVSVTPNAIMFLVPCSVAAGANVPVTINVNGATTTVNLTVLPASPGIFQSVQSDGVSRAVLERPDGTFVSPTNPARRGENVTAFVTGLGAVTPALGNNALPIPGASGYTSGTPSTVAGQVIVGVNNAGTVVTASTASPDIPGLYLVTFQVPQNAPQNSSVIFSMGVVPSGSTTVYYSAGTVIPVQ